MAWRGIALFLRPNDVVMKMDDDGFSPYGDRPGGRIEKDEGTDDRLLSNRAFLSSERLREHPSEPVSATVPIQAPPSSEGEAVDIRLDEEEGTTFRSVHQNTDQSILATSKARSTAGASQSETLSSSLWMTPACCVQNAILEARGWQVSFVKQEVQDSSTNAALKPVSSADGKAARPSATPQMLASSPPSSTSGVQGSTQEGEQLIATAVPSLTEKNLFDSLPHPNAMFYPDIMEWQVILLRSELEDRYEVTSARSTHGASADTKLLWTLLNMQKECLPKSDRAIIALPQLGSEASAPAWQPIRNFHQYQSTTGLSVYSTTAGQLSSVVPKNLLNAFREERTKNPRPGMSGLATFFEAASTLIKIVGNAANGEVRALTASGKTISTKLGLDRHADSILTSLGFQRDESADSPLIKPPDMTSSLWQLRLRRAYIELEQWLHHEKQQSSGQVSVDIPAHSNVPWALQVQTSQSFVEHLFGVDPNTQQSRALSDSVSPRMMSTLNSIGVDGRANDEMLRYCYEMNCKGRSTIERITFLSALVDAVEMQGRDDETLQTMIAMEKSQGLFTMKELTQAYKNILDTDLDTFDAIAQVDESFLIDMYRTTAKSVASETDKLQGLKDSFSIISRSRNCPSALEEALTQTIELDVEKAYEILEVQHDTDEDFIISAFQLASTESRFSSAQCVEALRVIGEHRNSSALKRLFRTATGLEEEDVAWTAGEACKPAGLNNIGNTCYLNSVLQYFYAIRPLRERVIKADRAEAVLKKEDAPRPAHFRVGGRNITQREVERSHRFVELLGQLFGAMKTSPASAVTPERDLAYLALVSSRVEEEEEEVMQAKHADTAFQETQGVPVEGQGIASDRSTATEMTLVDEPFALSPTDARESQSVKMASTQEAREGIQRPAETAPSLPPRQAIVRLENVEVGQRRNSLMQLGAQQDVSECLDNVMFQVEAALFAKEVERRGAVGDDDDDASAHKEIRSNGREASNDDDLLRKLFLGVTNQRLEEVGDGQKGRGTGVQSKKEVFKILPVNAVEEGRDIYDGLDGFFDEEMLTNSDGRPICRTVALVDAPAIMQIQLQRVQYDRTRGAYKSQVHLAMGETLFMDRYMDFDVNDEIRIKKRQKSQDVRRQVAALRSRILDLRQGKGEDSISRTLDKTASLLASLQKGRSVIRRQSPEEEGESEPIYGGGMPSELLDEQFNIFLQSESKSIDDEIRSAEERIEELKALGESLWSDERRFEYVLASVFMHRGEATHGHYFLNQRTLAPPLGQDHGRPSSSPSSSTWFKYNDNVIQEISLDQVLKDTTGATPYLLSYVRKDIQDSIGLFEAVCREIDLGTEDRPSIVSEEGDPEKENQRKEGKGTDVSLPRSQGAGASAEDVNMSDGQQGVAKRDENEMDTSL